MIDDEIEQEILRFVTRDSAVSEDGSYRPSAVSEIRTHLEQSVWSDAYDFGSASGQARLENFLDEMANNGLLDDFLDSGRNEKTFIATDQGEFEVSFGLSNGLVLDERLPIRGGATNEKAENKYNSEAWTGLKKTRIHARNAKVVSFLIDDALDQLAQSDEGNEAVMQAAAYLRAAKELVDAPVPPSDMIWDLVQKAAAIAGLLQLFLAIFSKGEI